jgi:hypothetical protein
MLIFVAKIMWSTTHALQNAYFGAPQKRFSLLVGVDIFYMVKNIEVIFGKGHGGQSVPHDADGHAPMWKKKSIFWELEY